MRYYIRHGIEIRAENAAKPDSQKSRFIEGRIRSLPMVGTALIYGSGKLRFFDAFKATSRYLVLCDSTIQMERDQTLLGVQDANYEKLFGKSNSVKIASTKDLLSMRGTFDRIHCYNVLTTIPIPAIRRSIFYRASSLLAPNGTFCVANRWRNSEFNKMRADPRCLIHEGGLLMKSLRGYSYYYEMQEKEVLSLAGEYGLVLVERAVEDGCYFLQFARG